MTNLWAATTAAIERLPKIDGGLLSIIETLIVSSLRSRHKAVLNQSILFWNRTFGSVDGLEYPNALRPVLLRLRTLTELDLPNFTVDDDTEVYSHHSSFINSVRLMGDKQVSSPIIFLNSQPDEDDQARERSAPFDLASDIASDGKLSSERVKQSTSNLKRSPLSSAKKRGVKTTPKACLRHDDSQIQFAAIDSSPLQPDEVESQMLTDRQKEVRQRQILEATNMFSNLGQVPKSTDHVANEIIPRLHFAENGIPNSPIFTGDEVTGSPVQDDSADVVGSSPTPRSRIERFRPRPVVHQQSLSPVVQVGSSSDIRMPSELDAPTEPPESRERDYDADLSDRDMPTSKNDSFVSLSEDVGETPDSFGSPMVRPRTPTRKRVAVKEPIQKVFDSSSLSGNEVFVDARPQSRHASDDIAHNEVSDIAHASAVPPLVGRPSNEAITGGTLQEPATPITHHDTPEMSQDPDVFTEAPHTPNEDEQIAAQLVNDLERASSQAESERRGNLTWMASPITRAKRKRAHGDSEPDWKKKKPRMQPTRKRQNIQIVVDPRQAGKAGAENVDIGADDLSSASSPHAKLKKIDPPVQGAKGTKGAKGAKGARGGPKRTMVGRHGPGRGARSSSTSGSTERDSCGTCDVTRLSTINVKRKRADHPPVGERRRSARLHGLPRNSPALPGSDAARMSSDEFGDFSGGDIPEGISVKVEDSRADRHSTAQQHTDDAAQGLHEMVSSRDQVRAAAVASKHDTPVRMNDSNDVPEEGNEVGAPGILQSFRKLLENIKRVTLGIEEEREIVSVLVDSVREVHEAGRRHEPRKLSNPPSLAFPVG